MFRVGRTVKLDGMHEPSTLKYPELVCVFSGRCTEKYAANLAARYPEAYYVEATKKP